jgi:acyl carrier protein
MSSHDAQQRRLPGDDPGTAMAAEIRGILAAVTGREELLHIPADAAMFGTGVGLDSLSGTLLLREIRDRFGVDVAAEDLNLDSLATLATLAAFVADRRCPAGDPR